MPHHPINVRLSPVNRVIVTPNRTTVNSGHTADWTCGDGALRIIFDGTESPFSSGELSLSAPSGVTDIKTIRRASKKRFKYTAEVTPPGGGGPHSVDPELMISDGGGGPKKKGAPKKAAGASKRKASASARKRGSSAKKAGGAKKKASPSAKKKTTSAASKKRATKK